MGQHNIKYDACPRCEGRKMEESKVCARCRNVVRGPRTDPISRFWAKIDKQSPDDCWNWQGSLDGGGYGDINISGRIVKTHRLSYQIAYGNIPDGMFVCHSCDNRRCVNPAHLWLGTNKDNMNDMKQKGRAKSGGARGKALPQTKLSETDVIEIRNLYASRQFTQKVLGQMFGVSRQTIGEIIQRKYWRYV